MNTVLCGALLKKLDYFPDWVNPEESCRMDPISILENQYNAVKEQLFSFLEW